MPGDTTAGDGWFQNITTSVKNWGNEVYKDVRGSNGVVGAYNPDGYAAGDTLGQSGYNFNYTVFPSTIGMDDMGHYMVININVPTQGQKISGLALGDPAGSFKNLISPLRQVSKLDVLRFGNYNSFGAPKASPLSVPRNTRRIAESIALYMPTPLVFNDQNVYEEVSLTALGGRVGIASTSFFGNAALAFSNSAVGKALGLGILATGSIIGSATQGGAIGAASSIMQNPINPAVEIVFANKMQRQFTFELLMAARNETESIAIKKIIKSLRFHGSPEVNPRFNGFTWIPPADFDITFFNKGVENTHILRINTCVMERVEVDYAPSGNYSTFRNGHPVQVRLSLCFRELEPISKLRVLQGF